MTIDYAEEPFTVPAAKSRDYTNQKPNMLKRYFGLYPLEQRIDDKKRGVGVQRFPIACVYASSLHVAWNSSMSVAWLLSAVMLGVLIYELVTNSKAQGSPFSFKVWWCRVGNSSRN